MLDSATDDAFVSETAFLFAMKFVLFFYPAADQGNNGVMVRSSNYVGVLAVGAPFERNLGLTMSSNYKPFSLY